ncbi:glycosyl hydrolase family 65 protein [Pedobacter sp. BG31]|uniref:MGH1-like glycoside hydrolase domain-containing protein n=1 Tax=Pedobacter sp. BG31 TaxID=3349697 RepID=UPI0035F2D06B
MKLSFYLLLLVSSYSFKVSGQSDFVLKEQNYRHYIEEFNSNDKELYTNYIPNAKAWDFLSTNIPLFECPDKNLELTYYFRWWTFRKHIKNTPDGFIITEFLPNVYWAGKYNSINCAAALHIYEGRWLKDQRYIKDYANFWFRKGGDVRSYSFWAADALWANYLVNGDKSLLIDLSEDLTANYYSWEKGRIFQKMFIGKNPDGLFSTVDDRDAMEMSIGKHGKRPTINSYMYGDAIALSKIAGLSGKKEMASIFLAKSDSLKKLVVKKLWDKKQGFFKTMPYHSEKLVDVRELLGYTPWYFNLPPDNLKYANAWQLIHSKDGFYAPYGLTTAEQGHREFELSYTGHECKWNGPSWPYSTSITLTALANLLNNYQQKTVSKKDYMEQLQIFANAHRRINEDGALNPWIDENINPFTGDWISRTMLKELGWPKDKGGEERGKDYNHSTFADLVISGLVGIRPQDNDTVIINPLVPENTWEWFCLDNISYHGKTLSIVYDRYGKKYKKGKGLMCFINGKLKVQRSSIEKIVLNISQ